MCTVWPQSSSATQCPSSSAWKPTIRCCTRPPPSRRRSRVDVRRPTLHVGGGSPRRPEAIALVEPLRVACEEGKPAKALEIGVRQHTLHQPLRESTAPIILDDEHVREIGVGRQISDDPPETDLA